MNARHILGSLAVLALALTATSAGAATCKLRSSSGTCLLYSGSVIGDLVTDNTSNHGGDTQFTMVVHPTGDAANTLPAPGLATCGNPGKNGKPSPGIQLIQLPDFGFYFADANSGPLPINKNNIHGGIAEIITGEVPFLLKDPNVNPCPNPGWTVLDSVACSANLIVKNQFISGTTIDTATEFCTLNTVPNSCQTLGFIPSTGLFDTRQFDCSAATVVTGP